MSSEADTSLEISGATEIGRFLDRAHNDKAPQTKRALFAHLSVYHDETPRFAAMNMSVDEALLETASIPTIRFYRWQSPAVSFGYFGKFCDVARYAGQLDTVRRWTGGGIVFHVDDLTYSIVIPASDPVFGEPSIAIYERIHSALADALNAIGKRAVVAAGSDVGGGASPGSPTRLRTTAGVNAAGYSCFANPVYADVMVDGRKVAGAAQRRTRRGLMQQGSIQAIPIKAEFAQKFAQRLSAGCSEFAINEEILQRAHELTHQKYGTDLWLRKR